MKRSDLTFTAETAPHIEQLLALSDTRLLGTEIYTYSELARGNVYGQLWAGLDDAGRPVAALLDNGQYRTFLTPSAAAVGQTAAETADFFHAPKRSECFRVMLKKTPDAASAPDVLRLEGGAILKTACVLRQRTLRPEEETRYVYYARAVNAGLADVFVLTDAAGNICGCAQIMAKNRRYALIGNVYTVKRFRGQGVAGKLLAACEAQAAKEGLLPVLYCNKNMTSFYKARGYRIVKKHDL